jgi:hypothetical protein
MADPLATYLTDHLAAAKFSVDLLEGLIDKHAETPFGEFTKKILKEVSADRAVLQNVYDDIHGGGSALKEAAAWFSEQIARLKLRFRSDAGFGDFEALELLALGILGKAKLWVALSKLAPFDERIRRIDLDHLIQRAQLQHDEVERYRLAAATKALSQSSRT